MKATRQEISVFRQDMLNFRARFPAKYVRQLLEKEPKEKMPQELIGSACSLRNKYAERKELSAVERRWQMPAMQIIVLLDAAVTGLFIGALTAHENGKPGLALKLFGAMLLAGAAVAVVYSISRKFYLKYRNAYSDVQKVYEKALGIEKKED
jgi:hypothetical protein